MEKTAKATAKTTATPSEYAESFRRLLASGEATAEWLNQANHLALEMEMITMEHFHAAARVLAEEILTKGSDENGDQG